MFSACLVSGHLINLLFGTWRFNRMIRADKKEGAAVYQRVVLKNTSPYHYMKVCL